MAPDVLPAIQVMFTRQEVSIKSSIEACRKDFAVFQEKLEGFRLNRLKKTQIRMPPFIV